MGVTWQAAELIFNEHRYRPITGRILLIGRQTVLIGPQELGRLLELYQIERRSEVLDSDTTTIHQLARDVPGGRISDTAFFSSFSDGLVQAIDVSDYEGADILHDLNRPIPDSLKNQFDLIYDGSCLDNIFDPVQVLRNISQMLRPGGRVVLLNATNSVPTAYLKFSPDWFADFFAINGYSDCKVYVVERSVEPSEQRQPSADYGHLWRYEPLVVYSGQKGYQCSSIESLWPQWTLCLAEKAETSTSDRLPIQMHYRGTETAEYVAAAERFNASARTQMVLRTGTPLGPDRKSISTWDTLAPVAAWAP